MVLRFSDLFQSLVVVFFKHCCCSYFVCAFLFLFIPFFCSILFCSVHATLTVRPLAFSGHRSLGHLCHKTCKHFMLPALENRLCVCVCERESSSISVSKILLSALHPLLSVRVVLDTTRTRCNLVSRVMISTCE